MLISALVFPGGVPEQVYRIAIEGRIALVTSPPLLAELCRVLTEQFGWQDDYLRAGLAQIGALLRAEVGEELGRTAVAGPASVRRWSWPM